MRAQTRRLLEYSPPTNQSNLKAAAGYDDLRKGDEYFKMRAVLPPPVHKHEPPLAKTHEYRVKGEYPHTSPERSVRSVSARITTVK